MPARRLFQLLAAFIRQRDGVAAVEFALILPFMLLLYIGSLEVSALVTVDRRVNTISGSVGDLVSRIDGSISSTTLTDYFVAAEKIIAPHATLTLRQVITCVEVLPSGQVTVRWSRGHNGGVAHSTGGSLSLPPDMISVARGSFLIVSETSYAYKPLLGIVFDQAINMYHENFYLPRSGEYISVAG